MRKLTIICCCILITALSTGSYLIYSVYLSSYKKEFRSFLSQNKQHAPLSVIWINPSELYTNSLNVTWEDGNKEVVYQGILYDIVKPENRGLKVALIAVSDEQEMSLKKEFSEQYNLNAHETTKNPFHLLKNFLALKTIITHVHFCFEKFISGDSSVMPAGFFLIPSIFISEDTPPPDFSY